MERVQLISEKTTKASKVLATSVEYVASSMEQGTKANEEIALSAASALEQCQKNLRYVQDSSSTIMEISGALNGISVKSADLAETFAETYKAADVSQRKMQEAMLDMQAVEQASSEAHSVMLGLYDTSGQIGKIVTLINSISRQINILALNASIESVKAGSAGSGFAVVAAEVKRLAEQTNDATSQISDLIEGLQKNTRSAMESVSASAAAIQTGMVRVKETGSAIERLVEMQKATNAKVQDISSVSSRSGEHSSSLQEVIFSIRGLLDNSLSDMQSIAGRTQAQTDTLAQIAASLHDIEATDQELSGMSEQIIKEPLQSCTGAA